MIYWSLWVQSQLKKWWLRKQKERERNLTYCMQWPNQPPPAHHHRYHHRLQRPTRAANQNQFYFFPHLREAVADDPNIFYCEPLKATNRTIKDNKKGTRREKWCWNLDSLLLSSLFGTAPLASVHWHLGCVIPDNSGTVSVPAVKNKALLFKDWLLVENLFWYPLWNCSSWQEFMLLFSLDMALSVFMKRH